VGKNTSSQLFARALLVNFGRISYDLDIDIKKEIKREKIDFLNIMSDVASRADHERQQVWNGLHELSDNNKPLIPIACYLAKVPNPMGKEVKLDNLAWSVQDSLAAVDYLIKQNRENKFEPERIARFLDWLLVSQKDKFLKTNFGALQPIYGLYKKPDQSREHYKDEMRKVIKNALEKCGENSVVYKELHSRYASEIVAAEKSNLSKVLSEVGGMTRFIGNNFLSK